MVHILSFDFQLKFLKKLAVGPDERWWAWIQTESGKEGNGADRDSGSGQRRLEERGGKANTEASHLEELMLPCCKWEWGRRSRLKCEDSGFSWAIRMGVPVEVQVELSHVSCTTVFWNITGEKNSRTPWWTSLMSETPFSVKILIMYKKSLTSYLTTTIQDPFSRLSFAI